jgi:hypothetical protein
MQGNLMHGCCPYKVFQMNLEPALPVLFGVARAAKTLGIFGKSGLSVPFHDSIEHSPQSSRVVPSGHEHNGSELMLVAPWRKHLTFTFGSSVGSGDLNDIRDAKPPQLANLPCRRILVREARGLNLGQRDVPFQRNRFLSILQPAINTHQLQLGIRRSIQMSMGRACVSQ